MNLIGSTLKGLVSALSKTTLVTILVMFMLVEAAGFKRKLRAAFGEVVELDRVRGITRDVRRYLGIKTVTSAITGLLVGGWATLMDVDFPWLWAFVAFLFNYVPFVGSIIAAIPAVLLALLVHSVPVTLVVAIGYIVINVGVSNFLEPIIMGQGLGLSPLVVFCSLVVWGWVWGPAGALMSVPLTMIVKIFLEHTVEFRWIAVLMGPSPRGDS